MARTNKTVMYSFVIAALILGTILVFLIPEPEPEPIDLGMAVLNGEMIDLNDSLASKYIGLLREKEKNDKANLEAMDIAYDALKKERKISKNLIKDKIRLRKELHECRGESMDLTGDEIVRIYAAHSDEINEMWEELEDDCTLREATEEWIRRNPEKYEVGKT